MHVSLPFGLFLPLAHLSPFIYSLGPLKCLVYLNVETIYPCTIRAGKLTTLQDQMEGIFLDINCSCPISYLFINSVFIKCESRFTLVSERKHRKANLGHSKYPTTKRFIRQICILRGKSIIFKTGLCMNTE